ncbi:hypothetical protein M2110_005622 [Paenibacillus sp. PastF-4]|nr:hypothetical protein [Paenibacillus sp. PastF-4]
MNLTISATWVNESYMRPIITRLMPFVFHRQVTAEHNRPK